jgi:hypothetical protein
MVEIRLTATQASNNNFVYFGNKQCKLFVIQIIFTCITNTSNNVSNRETAATAATQQLQKRLF